MVIKSKVDLFLNFKFFFISISNFKFRKKLIFKKLAKILRIFKAFGKIKYKEFEKKKIVADGTCLKILHKLFLCKKKLKLV